MRPQTLRRRELPPLSAPRSRPSAVVTADGRVAVIGGNSRPASAPATGECEVDCHSSGAVDFVDARRGAVTPGRPLRSPREGAAAGRAGDRLFIASGFADHG